MIHLCLIGLGGMGKKHFNLLMEIKDVKLTVVDSNIENIRGYSIFLDVVFTNNLNGVCLSLIDAFIIATPLTTRLEILKIIADYKKPIFFEKPFGLNYSHGLELEFLLQNKNSFVAYPRRFSTGINLLKKYITSQEFDTIFYEANFAQDFQKYRPDFALTYYSAYNTGGGFKMDGLNHHFDLVNYLFDADIKVLYSDKKNLSLPTRDVDDFSISYFKIFGVGLGLVKGNQFQKENEDWAKITTDKFSLCFDRISDKLTYQSNDMTSEIRYQGNESWTDLLKNQLSAFIDVVRNDKVDSRLCSIADANKVLDVFY